MKRSETFIAMLGGAFFVGLGLGLLYYLTRLHH